MVLSNRNEGFSMEIAKYINVRMDYKRSNLLNILQIIKTYRWRERDACASEADKNTIF